jgi:sugar lactone lactonase YvrE
MRCFQAIVAGCELAERPVWDDHIQTLVWVDILGGNAHRLPPEASHGDRKPIDAGCLAPGVRFNDGAREPGRAFPRWDFVAGCATRMTTNRFAG